MTRRAGKAAALMASTAMTVGGLALPAQAEGHMHEGDGWNCDRDHVSTHTVDMDMVDREDWGFQGNPIYAVRRPHVIPTKVEFIAEYKMCWNSRKDAIHYRMKHIYVAVAVRNDDHFSCDNLKYLSLDFSLTDNHRHHFHTQFYAICKPGAGFDGNLKIQSDWNVPVFVYAHKHAPQASWRLKEHINRDFDRTHGPFRHYLRGWND